MASQMRGGGHSPIGNGHGIPERIEVPALSAPKYRKRGWIARVGRVLAAAAAVVLGRKSR